MFTTKKLNTKLMFLFAFSITALLLIVSSKEAYPQSNAPFNRKKETPKNNNNVALTKDNSNFSQTPTNNYTQRELEILEEINQVKQADGSQGNGEKILELQRKLEATNGSTVTKQDINPIGTLIPASQYNPQQTDDISFSSVISFAYNYVAGISAQVEQRGTTAGKIWLAISLANGDTNIFGPPDTIAVYNSTNNGATYNLYAKIAFSNYNRNDFDNIDLEIIENNTGTKYLYIVFGYTTLGGSGQKLIGYTIVSTPTLGYFGSTFLPPGYSSTHNYINARVTSDNARYASVPYVTVVITQDSVANNASHIISKVARFLSPYTLNPAVTYLPKSIYGTAEGFFDNYVFTDVANYHNGSDSLIFVLSKYPGYMQNIYLYKAFSNTTVYPVPSGILTPTGDNLEFAKIAANAGTNQTRMIITYTDDYLNSGDLDQWILYSDDGSNWQSNVLDYTSYNNSRYGDIIGRRNADGSYNITFKNTYGYLENVSSVGFTDFTLTSSLHALNTDYANSTASPKPLFRFVDSDSCLSIWSYYYSVSASGGCSVSNLYVTLAVEGLYNEVLDQHNNYAVYRIMLADQNPPYTVVDTGLAYLDITKIGNVFAFPRALTGDYYLVCKHYNSLETWSAAPVHVEPTSYGFYDFTSSDAQAYGNNMVLKGTRWCVYSGDLDQDGNIDGTDTQIADNDAYNFIMGEQKISDVNGDYIVDGSDIVIIDNNAFNFVSAVVP